ncbi:MAG: NACHT domain-containing protein [Cyanobacteria bacterium J06639_14]
MRTEMARLALPPSETQNFTPLQPGSSSSSPQAPSTHLSSLPTHPLFALAQQMRGWFETLGFRFESHEIWQEDTFEWIINIPVRRGRYDRILVRGIDGEAGLHDVESLKEATATHRTDEGWLVTARRISRAAREAVRQEENASLGCYTLDELLDQDADFSSYLTWLESEIQQRGINQNYVPLACLKEEVDPDTQQRIGVSRYDDRDGWIEGYIDRWLDDPAKEHISVLGEFGTGKTWFALHYAWQALQRYREAQRRGLDRPRLPLVVPLRDYAKAVSVESLFSEFFFRKHEIPIPGYSAFEQLNRMGKLLLIFDGFDEMAARVDRQQMINNFWELAKVVVPGAKVILTCRTEHFPEAREGRALLNAELQASTKDLTGETPQFEVLELEKFNDEQIRRVLSHQARSATVEQIMGNPELLDLARRPVLTELILEALPDIEAGKPVDMSRVYLYAVRHKMERDIKAERTFTSMADKLYFMCELSWEMLSTDRMSINYREFPDRIRKLFGPAVEEQKDLDHWHYDMMGQTMLIRNAEGDYTPAHRSLLEFFVAYKFASELEILAPDFADSIDGLQLLSHLDLANTFGKIPLAKAIIDLLVPMLERSESTTEKLLSAAKSTQGKDIGEVGYLGGNAITLLLKIDPTYLEGKDLRGSALRNADFTNAKLFNLNLKDSTLINTNFTQSLGFILSVTVSHDGNLIATSDSDCSINLWRLGSGQLINIFRKQKNRIYSVSFSPDSRKIISSSADRTIQLWDIQTGQHLNSFSGHSDIVRSAIFSPDGKYIASGSFDKTLKIWDIDSGECIKTFQGHCKRIWSVKWHPQGELIASASSDGTIKIWNITIGECIRTLASSNGEVCSAIFNSDGNFMISNSLDDSVNLYETKTWNLVLQINTKTSWAGSMAVSTSNKLAVGSNDGLINIFNLSSGKLERTFQGHVSEINSLAFNPSGLKLLSGGSDQNIKVWDLRTDQCERTITGLSDWIRTLAFDPSGKMLLGGRDDGAISVFKTQNEKRIRTIRRHSKSVNSVRYSQDGKILVVGSGDRTIGIWKAHNFELVRTLSGHSQWVSALALSPTENILASGDEDGIVKLWNLDTGKCFRTWQSNDRKVLSLEFESTGKILATAGADNEQCFIKLWNIKLSDSPALLSTLQGHKRQIQSMSLHPSNQILVSVSSDQNIKVWDLESEKCFMTMKDHQDWIWSVTFSPSGDLFATGSADCTIKLWNLSTGECLKTFSSSDGPIFAVAFHPSGSFLASASIKSTVRFWDIETGECIATLRDRIYEDLNITGVKGLTEAEKISLKTLGAVEN